LSVIQAVVAYALVALCAAWVVWSMFVPRRWKMRLRRRR
jgi:hypothetical protein